MRRSLASQYRVKTAHHLLNIVALKREMDTYSVDGLLKAASTGHSKEACLRYAGLHAALLLEKRAVDNFNFGPDTAAFKNNSPKPSAAATPAAAKPDVKIPNRGFASLFGGGSSAPKPAASGSGGGGYTGGNYMINTQATKPSTAPSNLDRSFLGGIADSQKATTPTGIPGLSIEAPAGPAPAMNAARTGSLRQAPAPAAAAPTPLTAAVIPKPTPTQGNANATSGLGYNPAGSGSGKPSGKNTTPTQGNANATSGLGYDPTGSGSGGKYSTKPSYTADPVEDAYTKQLNEGAAYSAASKRQSDEDAYMKSIEPTAPTYPVSGAAGDTGSKGQQAAAPAQGGFQRQQVIGSGAPARTVISNIQGRRAQRRGSY